MLIFDQLFRFTAFSSTFICTSFIGFWLILKNLPHDSILVTYLHPVFYLPRELLFLPFTVLSLTVLKLNKKFSLLFIVLFNSLLFSQLNYRIKLFDFDQSTDKNTIKVISLNRGGSGGQFDNDGLKRWILSLDGIDIIATQETKKTTALKFLPDGWNIECQDRLCLLSPHPITLQESWNREFLGGRGTLATKFELQIANKKVTVINVHLETIRKGIEDFLWFDFKSGFKYLKKNYENRTKEAALVRNITLMNANTIILGDFNTVVDTPLYQHFWSEFNDAFIKSGHGTGYTKFTRWHGIGIDHILTFGRFNVKRFQVGPYLKGDHHPIFAEISY